jgi:uncharacterized protein
MAAYDSLYTEETGAGRARNSETVNFEWDPRKAERNLRKHGVSFHEAATVFGDPLSITFHDPGYSFSEKRLITVGMSRAQRLLIVAHADHGETVRIISARKTTPSERKYYEEKTE